MDCDEFRQRIEEEEQDSELGYLYGGIVFFAVGIVLLFVLGVK